MQDAPVAVEANEDEKQPTKTKEGSSKQRSLYTVTENELVVHELLLLGMPPTKITWNVYSLASPAFLPCEVLPMIV